MHYLKHALILSAFFLASCSTVQQSTINDDPTTQATLWVQNAAEYDAIAMQTYATAMRTLPLPLEDSFWTASLNQEEDDNFMSLPPAIIMDVDETVLDNSPFQARMIKQEKDFNIEDWNAWCKEAKAEAVPGAVEFANYAADRGVTIFYITNRDYEVEEATRKNLIEEGFPVSNSIDNIMTNGEEPGWNSSKTERRQQVEENYRVVMVIGDDLNDFLPAKGITQKKRAGLVQENSDWFGRRWFILPNPVYGSWEQALFDFEDGLSESERKTILQKRLNSKN
ncbi:5'-nucleotidase, lipoprotein e(P4) family [Gracilimonas sediminicola]|uniref:5'-nucleotidase, lipoprotein e(P4) family n=1 Tax=Gracilimonas sediminicola TaxID=2952158 RepID=A0A9X2RH06_9BACT|nr:5'-nucleotidase, lipoprotein e(P4) family [Gracilimonas sediminicola]MCP9292737.1 5'-nucleotidase, lipoprotein e(P4) family [Gracilimonas sediminicola]